MDSEAQQGIKDSIMVSWLAEHDRWCHSMKQGTLNKDQVVGVLQGGGKGCGLVVKSCLTLCDPMDCSTPGFPVLHYPQEFAQILVL